MLFSECYRPVGWHDANLFIEPVMGMGQCVQEACVCFNRSGRGADSIDALADFYDPSSNGVPCLCELGLGRFAHSGSPNFLGWLRDETYTYNNTNNKNINIATYK